MRHLRILKSIRRLLLLNRLRTILSVTGIAVGIACEMAAVAAGNGAREAVMSQIQSMGSNLITVAAGTFKQAFGRKIQTTFITTLKRSDADAICEDCDYVKSVAPVQQEMVSAEYKGITTNTTLIGTTPNFFTVKNYRIASGRFSNSEENNFSQRVAVIGLKITQALFRRTDPVGQIVRINGIPFRVIGSFKSKGMSYDGVNQDDEILIPLNTALQRVMNENYIGYIFVEVTGEDKMDYVEREIRNLLRERHELNLLHEKDDFTIQNIYTTIRAANETKTSFSSLISAIASLSLVVGGVGILAVMLLSVKERRSEIGLRMAVGAKPSDVLFQFLIEATSLSAIGGLAGVALGIVSVFFLKTFIGVMGIITAESAGIAVLVSAIIGILFGSFPARRASLIKPAETLRG